MTDADLLRAKLEFETDAPVRTFQRDTHLTPQALFKGKVLAVLENEARKWGGGGAIALRNAAIRIEDIQA